MIRELNSRQKQVIRFYNFRQMVLTDALNDDAFADETGVGADETGVEADETGIALWAKITKTTDWSTGPLACPFACLLAPLTCSLVPHYSLRSRAPLRTLARLLTSLSSLLVGQ